MITEKTVFILGAGASKPYGFPTALELRKDIITTFFHGYIRKVLLYKSSDESRDKIKQEMSELINQFNLSSIKSIDLFLSRNKKFYGLGKEIIAFLIAEYEIKSKFREFVDNPSQDWYFEMFDLLTIEINDPENLVNFINRNNVSFITFNYDRSLEHFLYTSFYNSFATKRNELKDVMQKFKFIHLYGKLAPLPWESISPGYRYGDERYFEYFDEFVKNIRIIFDERQDGMDDAKNEISSATKIFFLGFGYADENLAALEFSSLLNENHWIYGTALGSTEVERGKIIKKLKSYNQKIPLEKIIIQDCDSVMLLRNYIE